MHTGMGTKGRSGKVGFSASRWHWTIRVTLLGFAILFSCGAVAPWISRSSDGETRRVALRSFAEDFEGSRRYPIYRACRLVHTLTEHRVDQQIAPQDNWIQWSLGHLYAPLLRTQDPDLILEKGCGDCSERVAVLQSLLRLSQIPTRIVGLGGHVVLEVQVNGKWLTADPDYGVVHFGTVEELASAAESTLERPLHRAGYSEETIDRYVELFRSQDDNTALPINAPISPRLYHAERFTSFMVVMLPCVAWLLTLFASMVPSVLHDLKDRSGQG